MTQVASLLVDVGNSRIKWSLLPVGKTQLSGPSRAVQWTLESLDTVLDVHWGTIDVSVQRIVIASVAGDAVQRSITDWCNRHWYQQPRFLSTSAQFGTIKNGYSDYRQLGIDRWVAVIAAHHLYPQNANIIIDCGTAITIDTVLPDGQHKAGPILAGREMVFNGLARSAAFARDLHNPATTQIEVFVSNTENAVLSGVNFATAKALEVVIEQIRHKLSETGFHKSINIVATGGAVTEIMHLTSVDNYRIEPDLVILGIQLVSAGES